jgi:protein O-GlcNAc transferase
LASSNHPAPAVQQAIVVQYQQGRIDEALESAKALTRSHSQHPFGWRALGALLCEQRRFAEAVACLRQAAVLAGDAESYNDLGVALQEAGDLDQAAASYREALQRKPHLVEAHANIGRLYHCIGRLVEAEASLRTALALRPKLAEALNTLASVLQDGGRLEDAEAASREAVALKPDYVDAHTVLGSILSSMGRHTEAEACFRRALDLRPNDLSANSNLLFNHCYGGSMSPRECLDEARRYGQRVLAHTKERHTQWAVQATPERLRVGLASGDLRQHPVGYFLEGLLSHTDGARLEFFAYPTQPAADALTERLRTRFAAWTPLYGHSDAEAARLIHAAGVHVLIDLSGHTAHNRLPLFAHRPAPVQVTWLGYFATTGVAEIDYLLADPISVPPEHESHFSETIWRLPDTRLCFTPPRDAPGVSPLPALANGFITFGSFQNLAKLNDEVLALWARVLAAVPTARLRLQSKQLADAAVRQRLGQRLQDAGIAADRVSMHGSAPRDAYLAAHAEVDLILDSFPFPGGTTTCEALWMGVPTLTLAGDRLIGL